MPRLQLAAAVAVFATAVAPAQSPTLRPVVVSSPVPAIVQERQQAWQAAQQQAYLWQLSQPPVYVAPYPPVYPTVPPYTPAVSTFRYTGVTPTGTLYETTRTFYRPATPFTVFAPFGGVFMR